KSFGDLRVIQEFSREIDDGELVALVGPSGCGKSTLLHMAAGLERPSGGAVHADGRAIKGPNPERTLMFQENALYPWLTLEQNVALALEFQGTDKARAREQARQWLAKVQLAGFEDYRSEEHTSELQSRENLVCRLLPEEKNRRLKARHHPR